MASQVDGPALAGHLGSDPRAPLPHDLEKLLARGKRGDGGPSDVIQPGDQRQRQVNAKVAPFRMICSIEVSFGGEFIPAGTGWLVGRRTVVTAGHVLWWASKVSKVRVIPGRCNRADEADAVISADFHFHPQWSGEAGQTPQADIAAICLPNPLGERLGWFPVQAKSKAELVDRHCNIAGYPSSVTNQDVDPCTELWLMVQNITDASDRLLGYLNDTSPGQSGAPVMLWTDDAVHNLQPVVVGVHSRGTERGPFNSGRWIDLDAITMLGQWVAIDNEKG